MNEDDYTDNHIHPLDSTIVEFVAYERRDVGWDVYVFEPLGSCPELETGRMDENHIFIRHIASRDMLEDAVADVERKLGVGYTLSPFYREVGTRRTIDRIIDYLQQGGAHNMHVHAPAPDVWELCIRRKDFALARQITDPDIPSKTV